MFKFILFFLVLTLNLFADFDFKVVKTQLLKTEDLYAYVKDDPRIKLNSSGIVMHNFDKSKSIIARASVIAKENGMAKLEFSVFSSLEQEALPLPNILPEVGDEVILNFLYDRAAVIAPDKQSYDEIVNSYPQFYFTHIDILGAQMIRNGQVAPKRSDLRKFCADNAVGILIFALEQKAKFVDCQDFKTLYEVPISKPSSVQVPFYSRITDYRSNFFDFNSQEIGNFYRYYEALIDLDRTNR